MYSVHTTEQKRWLIDLRNDNPDFKHSRLAEEFKEKFGGVLLTSSTVSDWLKPAAVKKVIDQSNVEAAHGKKKVKPCRTRDPKCAKLEAALVIWIEQKYEQDVTVTEEVLIDKAKQLAENFEELQVPDDFQFSRGWVYRFKQRSGYNAQRREGEANSADMAGVTFARENLAKILANFPMGEDPAGDMQYVNFAYDNIFNMDETGLFWRQHPTRTLGKGQTSGRKNEMERVTLGLACNATGTEKCYVCGVKLM